MPHAVRQLDLLGARPAGNKFRGVSYFDDNHCITEAEGALLSLDMSDMIGCSE